jgi:hypothetical protein
MVGRIAHTGYVNRQTARGIVPQDGGPEGAAQVLIEKEVQHASGPFRVLHLLQPLPQRREWQPMGVRRPLPFQFGLAT